ncbi:acylpyruvase FAHD1, mitochondrial-like isoform X2 [Varroa jacobsoni]|uniref:acylpyruvase FAHD1, mitochondrial-like isoform X2 n=1 Tax=Varroa jacobsoni TaxID=62625 RepID=UPI000BF2618C|nr:acylpyruvase FAHD1, mitochondrial-like isoform X2 [Varroa jacobsoni]
MRNVICKPCSCFFTTTVAIIYLQLPRMRLAHFVEFGRKIVCVGRNYAAHAKELNNTVGETPLIFLKPPTAYLMQGNGNIEPPPGCLELHHEVELGVLIERPGKNIPEGEAMQHVGGYTLCLDMTARDVQTKLKSQGAPWELAKAFDTSCPVGDFVPKESIVDPHNLNLWCKVNGIMRQKGNTKDMLFKIPQIVAYVSRYFTLEVGDLILTGTPQGVGPVKSGDTIEAGMNVNNYKMTFIIK